MIPVVSRCPEVSGSGRGVVMGGFGPCGPACAARRITAGGGLRDVGPKPSPNVRATMKLKRNGPLCYRCGGMKHRRDRDGRRWCRMGCLPSGRHLNSIGEPTTFEQRAAICARVRKIRMEVERKAAWRDHGVLGWVLQFIAHWMASAIMLRRSLWSMVGRCLSFVGHRDLAPLSRSIKSSSIPRPVLRARSPARAFAGDA